MKITPLDLRVLIKLDETEKKTAGGILIPDNISERNQMSEVRGEIIAVGTNAFHELPESDRPASGNRVMIARYAGIEVSNDNGPKHRIVNDEDVIAVLD